MWIFGKEKSILENINIGASEQNSPKVPFLLMMSQTKWLIAKINNNSILCNAPH
jgi:hypothetical protein